MEQIQISKIKEIYDLFADEESRHIFENRLMYSITGDMKFIRNIVCTIPKGREMYEALKNSTKIKVIFGAGSVGKRLVHVYNDVKFTCFVDNNYREKSCVGLPVISIQELKKKYYEALIIISSLKFHEEIMDQLLEEGFRNENILNLGMEYEKLNHLQYFDLPALESRKEQKEIFVDGGCFDGITSINFLRWCSRRDNVQIYAWEPDLINLKICEKLFEKENVKCRLIAKGLWSKFGKLRLKIDGTSSAVVDDGEVVIEVDSIDNCIKQPVTFIKMDIEGSERQGLLGAKNMLSQYKPKLAICVYHKPEDIWTLPKLIHEINPEYLFYMRHYSFSEVETVLYAL